jgi:hypothetical protein
MWMTPRHICPGLQRDEPFDIVLCLALLMAKHPSQDAAKERFTITVPTVEDARSIAVDVEMAAGRNTAGLLSICPSINRLTGIEKEGLESWYTDRLVKASFGLGVEYETWWKASDDDGNIVAVCAYKTLANTIQPGDRLATESHSGHGDVLPDMFHEDQDEDENDQQGVFAEGSHAGYQSAPSCINGKRWIKQGLLIDGAREKLCRSLLGDKFIGEPNPSTLSIFCINHILVALLNRNLTDGRRTEPPKKRSCIGSTGTDHAGSGPERASMSGKCVIGRGGKAVQEGWLPGEDGRRPSRRADRQLVEDNSDDSGASAV